MKQIVEFACPGCGRPCRLNVSEKLLSHSKPTCAVYESTKGDGQLFIKLAKQAAAPKSGKVERIN